MNIESTELQNSTETAIGYIPCYRLPFLSLFHADCMEIMKRYPDKYFDLAIVDPPYGIGANKMTLGNGKKKIYRGENDWDSNIPNAEYFSELFRISKNQVVWGGNYMTEHLPPKSSWLFWDKGTGANDFADGELAWSSFGGALRKIAKSWVGANAKDESDRIHPTQKPIYLYGWILSKYAKQGDKILDTHFGSGSIALAVDKANRLDKMNLHLTACEIDKEYIDKAIKRISESIKQGTLPF
jgi:site-specific DNA-methyltransferase (adenine-specific)